MDNFLDKVQILEAIRDYRRFVTKTEFAKFLDMTPQALNYWYTAKSFDAQLLIRKFPEINERFILEGRGEMLKADTPEAVSIEPSPSGRSQRIKAVVHYLVVNNIVESRDKLAEMLGISSNRFSTVINMDDEADLPGGFIQKLAEIAEKVNMSWLLTGVGTMLHDESTPHKNIKTYTAKFAPLLPIEVTRNECSIRQFLQTNRESIPFIEPSQLLPEFDFIFRATTNNMLPQISSGDLLFIKRVVNPAKIVNGECYCLDTKTIGLVYYYTFFEEGVYRLVPACDGYETIHVLMDDVYDLFSIEGVFRGTNTNHGTLEKVLRKAYEQTSDNLVRVLDQNSTLINQVSDFVSIIKKKI